MPSNSAAYMREYRARQKTAAIRYGTGDGADEIATLQGRVAELEAEVSHLKAELAKRPNGVPSVPVERFRTVPFTPVPKRK